MLRSDMPPMRLLLVSIAVLAACGKSSSKTSADGAACARYADLEIKCGDDTGEGARSTIVMYCEKARGSADDVMSQLIVLEANCAQTTTECPAYKACVDKAKQDTTPKL